MVKNFCAFLGLLALIAAQSAAAEPTTITLTGRAMGTTWSAKFIQPATLLDPAAVSTQLSARLEALEAIFSTYLPTSELSRFNTSPTVEWQPVSSELARVALASHELSTLTGGAFDATVAPLVSLWGFGPQRRTGSPPTSAEVAAARARVDYRRLEARLSPPALRKTAANLAADFSSMAKGFASDELSTLLASLGSTHHLVQIGGDIKTSGVPARDAAWRAMIESPIEATGSKTIPFIVALRGEALSTSGDSHNFFTVADRRYGHVIDPRTGEPATGPLASVSVIAPTCAESSSLATALFVLGAEAGYRFAVDRGLACLFIVRRGSGYTRQPTPALERFLSAIPP